MIWMTLPQDIKDTIYSYIIKQHIGITSKSNFKHYYDILDKRLLRRSILNSIRQDHHFVFEHLFNKYYAQFKKMLRYRYDGRTYRHFVEFLKYRIIEHQSMKCKDVIFQKLTNEYKWT